MIALALGLLALVLLWWLGRSYANADAKVLAKVLRKAGGWGALAIAAVLLIRGRFDMALGLAGLGWWLLGLPGGGYANPRSWPGSRSGSSGGGTPRVSRVRSVMIEMELDHASGEMEGTVLAGPREGRALSGLGREELLALRRECLARDMDGARLLEAYLDRRFPAWREDADGDAHARGRGEAAAGAMTEEEAREVLGLPPGAGEADIRRAHRTLMKKLHPDQGGSTYLAARVNQAKDILLSRHR
ncbi:DnaJ domain-containing protein [Chelatococcus daeguensis]|uniref:DnaJ domain-containing protein n=1 Tax=Chelatococcus daeguensis TaxID=444444 RepID=UPI000AE7994C|nr:DnaJ domain-containing protein [Chelatococcus daeguensis]MBM3082317.1 DnaJ domain-containing protein [Chelatococcus daeguensis]